MKKHEILEDESKVIVDGAKIICSYTENPFIKGPAFRYLRIPCGHGFMENGSLCAHDETCIPVENIPCFGICTSPHYFAMLKYLQAWKYEGTKLYEAYQAYGNGVREGLPCLLPLLDRWMNAKDKSVIENYMDLTLNFDFNSIENRIKEFKKQTKKKADQIYDNKIKDMHIVTLDNHQEYQNAGEELKAVKKSLKNIDESKKVLVKYLQDDMFYIQNISFTYVKEHLLKIKMVLINLETDITAVHKKAPNDVKQYNDLIHLLEAAIDEVEDLYKQVCAFKPEKHQLITMDSYLVCRGGGIISFLSSGQEFYDYCSDLALRIRNLVSLFINDCNDRLLNNRRKYTPYLSFEIDEEGYSYKKVIRALEVYRKMLDDVKSVGEIKMEAPIYLELISHAYFEEQRKKMLSLIGIMVTWFGTPEMTLFFGALQMGQAIANGDLASGYSAGTSIDSETNKIIGNVSKNAYTYNNIYSTATAMLDFFTRSADTWIEEIKISVFCTNTKELSDWAPEGACDYLHTAYCLLNQDGSVKEQGVYDIQERREFTFNGGEWNYTPAATLITTEHFGKQEIDTMDGANDIGKRLKPEQNQR